MDYSRITKFTQRFAELRKKSRLDKATLARLSDIDARRIGRFETGEKRPNSLEKLRLCLAFGCSMEDLFGKTDWSEPKPGRPPEPRADWPQEIGKYYPPRDRETFLRVWAARREKPDLCAALETEIARSIPEAQMWGFFNHICCGSGPEALYLLHQMSRPALPSFGLIPNLGFVQHPIVHPVEREMIGHLRFPALFFREGNTRIALFPQVPLRPLKRIHVVDALTGVRRRGKTYWALTEIDGAGHDSGGDRERQRELAMATLRIPAYQLERADFNADYTRELLQILRLD